MIISRLKFSFYVLNTIVIGALVLIGHWAIRSGPTVLLCTIPSGILAYHLWRRFFFLRILPDKLYVYTLFKGQNISITDIRAIWLWGRVSISYANGDAVTILTADGQTIQLADQVCGNMREIRQTLLDRFPGVIRDAPVIVTRSFWADCGTESFRGKFFLSLNALPLYLFVLVLGFASLAGGHLSQSQGLFLLLPFGIIWLLFGHQLFYFRLTADTFEVRNLFFPWVRKTWPLDDIYNIVFEFKQGKGTMNILCLHTNDLRSKHYYATGLRNRDWLALGLALQKRGIRVKNELQGVHLPEPADVPTPTAETR